MVDAVASYGINEYATPKYNCECCGTGLVDDDVIFEIDNGKWVCEECFRDYCIDNLDIYEMAKLWRIRKEKAYYLE